MKKFAMFIILLFASQSISSAQLVKNWGPVLNGLIPMSGMSSTHSIGFEAGVEANLDLFDSEKTVLNFGVSYNRLGGKTLDLISDDSSGIVIGSVDLPNYTFYKITTGPKFTNDKNTFLLPAVLFALDEDFLRIGFEVTGGIGFSVAEESTMEIGVKISWINLLLKEEDPFFPGEDESTIYMVGIGVKYLF